MKIWTVGHSTLPSGELVALLAKHGIENLADVRRFPSSRRHPQFNRESLSASLAAANIGYVHFPELGGRRAPLPHSLNTGWREDGFRGYADYMQAPAFAVGFSRLLAIASTRRCVIMCAEKDWRNCHRGLISDLLKAANHEVVHIVDGAHDEPHPYTKPARIIDGQLSYSVALPRQSSLDL